MSDFLQRMAESSRTRANAARARESENALSARAAATPAPLPLHLHGFDLIAELKRRSPAAGGLAGAAFDAAAQLEAYAAGGAAAVSVLTEPEAFDGSLEQMRDASALLRARGCPVMRKDFLVDRYQVLEARANGASGVLVIAAMLDDAALSELVACAHELGLFVLLEAFDDDDLARIARLSLPREATTLVGVNSRDLRTLAVDFGRFTRLAASIRDDVPTVAESGIEHAADIERVARAGYDLALVGSALMRGDDAARAVANFVGAGRDAARERSACS
jgi:indole-3-glycerol phosphate synthase